MSYRRALQTMKRQQVSDDLRFSRAFVFIGLFFGYCMYTVERRATVVVAKDLQSQLNLSNKDLGAINSSFSMMYGFSKFFGGVASDFLSCRFLFAGGLFLAGVSNLLFPVVKSLPLFCLLWGANGAAQGVGWPSLSQLLIRWFPAASRGTVWGLLTMSGNLGQTVSPVVLSWTNDKFGWKTTFLLPGIVGIGVSALCYLAISDKPPADVVAKAGPESKKPKEENGKKTQAASAFRTKVLTNVNFWLIVVADVLIYFVLKALSDWSMKMLKEDRKFSLIVSSSCLTAYEAGGVLGTLLTGFVSDKLGSRRNLTSLIYVGILFPSLVCLWQLPPGTSPMVISTVLFFAGFGVYGPKTLCGLAVRETHSVAAGTAGGFLGAAGQVGAAAAGYPLGLIADNYGWEGVYSAMVLASFLAIFLFFSLSQNEKRKSNKKMD